MPDDAEALRSLMALTPADRADVLAVVKAWPTLTPDAKASVRAMVKATQATKD